LWATVELSKTQEDWTQTLAERQSEAEEGAPNFRDSILKEFDARADKIAEGAPTEFSRNFIKSRLQAYRANLAYQASTFEASERASYTDKVARDSIDTARTEVNQNPAVFAERLAERNALIDSLRLPPERKRELKESAQDMMARDAVTGLIDRDAAGTLALLQKPVGKSGVTSVEALTADDRLRLADFAERKIAADEEYRLRLERQAEAEQAIARARNASDLEIKVYDGLATEAEIEQAFDDDRITAEKRTQLRKELSRQSMDTENLVADLIRVDDSINGGVPMDAGLPKDREAVSNYYDAMLQGGLDPLSEEGSAATAFVIRQTGVVPDSFKSLVRMGVRSGDTASAAKVADAVRQVSEVAPALLEQLDADEKAFAIEVSSMVAAGANPEKAVETVREGLKRPEAEKDLLRQIFRDGSKDQRSDLQERINDDFDTWLTIQPDPPLALEAEFAQLSESYFLRTGNVRNARQLAWEDLKRVWGLSTVNGKRELIKYPP
jgi:hypothetical protein